MASAVAGDKLDIHTGGEDLRFPHHDNELAQASAGCERNSVVRWKCKAWA